MKDVTLTPAMGHFLDMVNNDKPATGHHANENYARELMQLFTLGLEPAESGRNGAGGRQWNCRCRLIRKTT